MERNVRQAACTLASILTSLAVFGAEPERPAPEAAARYATVGSSVYRLHVSAPPDRMFESLAAGQAVRFEVAVPDTGDVAVRAFDLDEMMRPGAISWFDAPPAGPRRQERWSTVLAARIAVERGTLRIEYATGDDRVSLSFPEAGFAAGVCGPGDVGLPPVVIEVNAHRVEWDSDEASRSIADLEFDPKGAAMQDPLAALEGGFVDDGRFFNTYLGSGLLLDDLRRRSAGLPAVAKTPSPCSAGCLQCAAGVMGTAGSMFALIAACGSSVGTGGATAPACIGALMVHEAAAWNTVITCANCADCQSRQRAARSCDCSQLILAPRCESRCERPGLPE